MVIHYKCQNCGSDMVFDSESGMLSCHSCGRQDKIENLPEELITAQFTDDEAKEYHCENCGAILITEADTAATTCSFCGAGVVLADRLSGDLAPRKVIPFTVSKDQAIKAFQKWCRNGLLTPKGFSSGDRIASITGMYVPFWLFDLNSKVEARAMCTRVRVYERGDYIYTETKYYDAYRDINLDYIKIPADASEKMNDELMDKLEPYPYDKLKEFKTPYLAGYLAEKYNYTDEELMGRAKEKIANYIESYISSTFAGYNSVSYQTKKIHTNKTNSHYVLLPVWMLNYDYKGKQYMFAMNGKTGKIVGKPPLSNKKMAGWFAGIASGTFLVMSIVSLLVGGGL